MKQLNTTTNNSRNRTPDILVSQVNFKNKSGNKRRNLNINENECNTDRAYFNNYAQQTFQQ